MPRVSLISGLFLGLSVAAVPVFHGACITVVEQPAGGDTNVAGTTDNASVDATNDNVGDTTGGTDNDNAATNDNAAGGSDNGCDEADHLRVTYVNESSVRVVFVENYRDSGGDSIAASILSLQPAGSSGSTRVECVPCPAVAGVRNIAYFDASPSSDGDPPSDLSGSRFRCDGGITVTFHPDKTATITVDD